MKAYIKSSANFQTLQDLDVTAWDVPIASTTDESGSITAYGEYAGYEGNFILMDGTLYLIQSVSPDNSTTVISITSVLDFFDRPVTISGSTCGGILSNILTNDYINQTDPLYKYSYITVTNTDTTAVSLSGSYSFKELVSQFADSVEVTIDGRGFNLAVSITTANRPSHVVTFDGSEQLLSQTFSRSSVGKVTISGTDYYLKTDGTITTTMPASADRVQGEWVVATSGTADKVFAKNSESHKVEWMSFDRLGLRDSVRFRLNNAVYESTISYIGSNSTDTRYKYKSGELATTLTEKIRRMQ